MFNFRIIDVGDGTQVIDTTSSTPYSALTPAQMVEYVEVDVQLYAMGRKARKEREGSGRKRKLVGDIAHRLACFCGLA